MLTLASLAPGLNTHGNPLKQPPFWNQRGQLEEEVSTGGEKPIERFNEATQRVWSKEPTVTEPVRDVTGSRYTQRTRPFITLQNKSTAS